MNHYIPEVRGCRTVEIMVLAHLCFSYVLYTKTRSKTLMHACSCENVIKRLTKFFSSYIMSEFSIEQGHMNYGMYNHGLMEDKE